MQIYGKNLATWSAALFFIGVGFSHFFMPAMYLYVIPPYLPFPELLNYVSGLLEIVLGSLLLTRWRPYARWGLVALLIAIFPANVYMAMHPENFQSFPPALLMARLPAQLLFIYWVLRA